MKEMDGLGKVEMERLDMISKSRGKRVREGEVCGIDEKGKRGLRREEREEWKEGSWNQSEHGGEASSNRVVVVDNDEFKVQKSSGEEVQRGIPLKDPILDRVNLMAREEKDQSQEKKENSIAKGTRKEQGSGSKESSAEKRPTRPRRRVGKREGSLSEQLLAEALCSLSRRRVQPSKRSQSSEENTCTAMFSGDLSGHRTETEDESVCSRARNGNHRRPTSKRRKRSSRAAREQRPRKSRQRSSGTFHRRTFSKTENQRIRLVLSAIEEDGADNYNGDALLAPFLRLHARSDTHGIASRDLENAALVAVRLRATGGPMAPIGEIRYDVLVVPEITMEFWVIGRAFVVFPADAPSPPEELPSLSKFRKISNSVYVVTFAIAAASFTKAFVLQRSNEEVDFIDIGITPVGLLVSDQWRAGDNVDSRLRHGGVPYSDFSGRVHGITSCESFTEQFHKSIFWNEVDPSPRMWGHKMQREYGLALCAVADLFISVGVKMHFERRITHRDDSSWIRTSSEVISHINGAFDPARDAILIYYVSREPEGVFYREDTVMVTGYHTGFRPFHCDTCGKSFNRPDKFVRHRREHATRGVTCRVCRKYFLNHLYEGHLETHSIRTVWCEVCGKGFTAAGLKRHRRVHEKLSPLSSSATPKALPKQQRVSTPLTASLECTFCAKRFSLKHNLKAHMRIHSGDRPYRCDCGRSYRWYSSLRKHGVRCHEPKYPPLAPRPHLLPALSGSIVTSDERNGVKENQELDENSPRPSLSLDLR
uniref:C2H2-type domain-containing protein n=1 Tax=Compsopogon caeruleus TaxID=31354 RepID=A0A7S1TG83_9RHOD|mmetsp:Transcript_4491/g.8928  ORF Transcript_4491/g.8928 Transcript_4491/m.8928 type:complete len:764 (+) Transcript_4491:99-2390(+)|eukprot:CAMPEP_0184684046 /NCGR_PEP_ID=MMETSP0312-20130426/13599_1 /TAXON_ID=31354 /ORGANISM="Compsopogon coeruleus, Strain SAG 36.94" /LENGTH=763 /DNA_ID=CAMNT_0027136855 /DNA_START=18 /DNA_END=2309 /DNA_ORIENTATION=-